MVPVYSCEAKFELQCLSEKREQSVGNSNIEYDKKDKSVQKKMVMLDLQEDLWAWYHMSKRLKKNYKIEER